ncbi:MAG: ABC transporter ATP-binding protein [Candidatus Methanomethylophilaceae archaeon]|nr:ABC transporter ATP-binding protein [Candidatus Methanomethylophilaceae archaeon]MBR6213855.1 ABC transporter ATP-binding protein [Candidatus Methanomethylophilaceae archaeon]
MGDVIEINNLVKKYGDKTAVDGISFSVHDGELFGFLGPNGAGKTTTVRCISTLTNITSGQVLVNGVDIVKDQTHAKQYIGVIQQQISLDKDLTIRENMISHAMYHGMGKKERDERISELTEYFGLGEYLDKPVDSLSGGWKKRAAIVCAMLHQPKVLFLDEPTTGLDINARRLLWDVVKRLNATGTTIVLTTHYIEEAQVLCDRVGIIDRGKIIALDTPRALIDRTGKMCVENLEGKKTVYRYFPSMAEAQQYVTDNKLEDAVMRRTSLEDVFVELTGKSVGDQR